MKLSGIYKIINKTNGKYYVGSTNDFNKRQRDHIRELNFNRHHCVGLQRAWNKYGSVKFDFLIIEPILNKGNLLIIEQNYLDLARKEQLNCYNSSYVAGGGIIWKGGVNPRTGIPHTQQTKQIMSERAKGRVISLKQRNQVGEANKNRRIKREELKNSIRQTNWNYLDYR
jgi:group I intron endonuclease